jgi:hypothetical protein
MIVEFGNKLDPRPGAGANRDARLLARSAALDIALSSSIPWASLTSTFADPSIGLGLDAACRLRPLWDGERIRCLYNLIPHPWRTDRQCKH